MRLLRSQLDQFSYPGIFWWATGIEDTFITAPWPKTGRVLDEYELTGHYEKWEQDIGLMAELGVKVARYGIPWHRINPAKGVWQWEWTDRSLEKLLELGIAPIVDLVHYGLPAWIENSFVHPDFPSYMAEYASRVAERFKGRIYYYTPLNEPRITAWYCGKLGWWPPYKRGWKGFLEVMVGVCKGIVQTVDALEEIDPEIIPVHVDATDLYESADPSLKEEVDRRQEIVFLALDLIHGQINQSHALSAWLLKNGVQEESLIWFLEHTIDLPVIGINLYPMFSKKILVNTRDGIRIRMPYAGAEIVEKLGDLYFRRYQRPLMIAETASVGSIHRRKRWLEQSVQAVRRLRERGIPMIGYTWWPLFALVTWAYRQGEHEPAYYLKQMGLWDLNSDPGSNLERMKTPLVDTYRELVISGSQAVSELQPLVENRR